MMSQQKPGASRREFLKGAAVASAATLLTPSLLQGKAHADGSDVIRVGLIGCGGRGSGAANNCVNSSEGVKITAMADLFRDRLDSSRNNLKGLGDRFDVPEERCFVGFDAYQQLLDSGVDMVILATPPGFRPIHFEAAVAAGKHVFMEKPVATDGPGIRKVLAAAKVAKRKGLAVVAGTQRRHQKSYIETMQQIHDGAIGELVGAQVYWNQGGLWVTRQTPQMSDMEWQVRNWLYFAWASGDHIVEQHIHNIDVMNWAFGGPPEKANAMGGRQVRTGPEYGHIFDHFAVEYVYPGGVRTLSECRQIDGCWNRVSEKIIGTKGVANPSGRITGEKNWSAPGGGRNAYVQEHADLIASIRANEPLNEAERVAMSTLTAIMGRMSAYTGKEVTLEFALNSQNSLHPEKWQFGDLALPAVAIPGRTALV
jgi:predicted dehydrogenase